MKKVLNLIASLVLFVAIISYTKFQGVEALTCKKNADCKPLTCTNAEKWPSYPVCNDQGECECRQVEEGMPCTWDSDCKALDCSHTDAVKWPGFPVCHNGFCECRDTVPPAGSTPLV